MIKKLLNKFGYYKINQLAVGGMCGCCGKKMPKLIYIKYENDNWADIGICNECLNAKDRSIEDDYLYGSLYTNNNN